MASDLANLVRFDDLLRNERRIQRVEVTPKNDGGFAIAMVDIDTLWRRQSDGAEDRWKGPVCKAYTRCADGWKVTMHTGVLVYDPAVSARRPPDR